MRFKRLTQWAAPNAGIRCSKDSMEDSVELGEGIEIGPNASHCMRGRESEARVSGEVTASKPGLPIR